MIIELGCSTSSEDDRRAVELIISSTYLGTLLAFGGGVPADRLKGRARGLQCNHEGSGVSR